MTRKFVRVGEIREVFVPSLDFSKRFAATLIVNVNGDPGRDYVIHVTAEQIAALRTEES